LKTGGRGMTAGRERFGLRRILVTTQVALCFVLLVSALLFVRSLRNLLTLDPGFQQNGVLIANVDFTRLGIPVERRNEFGRELLEKLQRLPGVESAAEARIVPLGGWSSNNTLLSPSGEKLKNAWVNSVAPGYFETLETQMLAGRDFDASDTLTSPKVAIVNETFVKKFLNGADPAGKTFRMQGEPGKPVPTYEIVGLVKDSKYSDLHEEFLPTAYFPLAQDDHPDPATHFLIRASTQLSGLIASVKSAIDAASPQIDIEFRVFKTQIRESLLQDELMAMLSGFFGFLAALLAAIGLYGVISYGVSQRTNEIGIRMALGAQRGDVVELIVREAALLLAVGLAVGCGLALVSAHAANSLLFGLKARDPLTFALAVVTLSLVAALASFVPAYRASRLDPMVALHYE
jgi:putative ABC transport system permease protein